MWYEVDPQVPLLRVEVWSAGDVLTTTLVDLVSSDLPRRGGCTWQARCSGCGRLVRRLYVASRLDPDPGCRICRGLAYRSQRRSITATLLEKILALRAEYAEAPGSVLDPFPARPSGRHRRKYERTRTLAGQLTDDFLDQLGVSSTAPTDEGEGDEGEGDEARRLRVVLEHQLALGALADHIMGRLDLLITQEAEGGGPDPEISRMFKTLGQVLEQRVMLRYQLGLP